MNGNLVSPLVDLNPSALAYNNQSVPHVFGKPYTKEEIEAIKKAWQPLLTDIENNIKNNGYHPENYPAMDMTVIVSRVLATFSKEV